MKSTRDRIRDAAEELLRTTREPLHNSRIASEVLGRLGLSGKMSAKDVNTCLHDDPRARFKRVAPGTWTLREFWP